MNNYGNCSDYVWNESDEFVNYYDDEGSDWNDFDFLKFKILVYLQKFGNCTEENWLESDDFNRLYQDYLNDNSTYGFNESDESYEIYSKIFNSIVSTFGDYNLTENETNYLKFLVMYFLNNYGNCTNYTWNESDDFANFTDFWKVLSACFYGCGSAPDDLSKAGSDKKPVVSYKHDKISNLNNDDGDVMYGDASYFNMAGFTDWNDMDILSNLTSTSKNNNTNATVINSQDNSWLFNILSILVMLLFVIVMII